MSKNQLYGLKKGRFVYIYACAFGLLSPIVGFAQDLEYLFDPFVRPNIPKITKSDDLEKSDLKAALKLATPAKDQGSRGTCSIFAATAALETFVAKTKGIETDLSEQYLQYKVKATEHRGKPTEGSNTSMNVSTVSNYGIVDEETSPYERDPWQKTEMLDQSQIETRDQVCLGLSDESKFDLLRCWIAQGNPNFDPLETIAANFAKDLGLKNLRVAYLPNTFEIKKAIARNEPVIISMEVFYRAFNHGRMRKLGLGEPDSSKIRRGEIGTPDAEDIEKSRTDSARHAMQVIGFDDFKRVFYLKNSWGQHYFGSDFKTDDGESYPGFGTITYDYAFNHAEFNVIRKTAQRRPQ